ncbi:MAG: GNAT family N-acetyltransferase [Alicyclobacillus sp.]|nr:GNAT family N-acetyltransferase [Alicyclobacillus sp.]
MKAARALVLWLSMTVAAGSLGGYGWLRLHGAAVPRSMQAGMAYGCVFVLFYLFDRIGRQTARLRRDKDAQRPRPSPLPVRYARDEVQVERVLPGEDGELQVMLNDCAREVLALAGVVPAYDTSGAAVGWQIAVWRQTPGCMPFWIRCGGEKAGCCVLQAEAGQAWLLALYVQPAFRRRRAATWTVRKLVEGVALLGVASSLAMPLRGENARARRFAEQAGFHRAAAVQQPAAQAAAGGTQMRDAHTPAADATEVWLLPLTGQQP